MTAPLDIAADYLSRVDAELPGLVQGLYLVGSVALADHQRGSDVDFVAVTGEPLDRRTTELLRPIHSRRKRFDGLYVTWADLAGDPRTAAPGAHSHGGVLHEDSREERHPVTWHTLAQCGKVVRGPEEPVVWTDGAALAESVRENLAAYWRPWHTAGTRLLSRQGALLLADWGPVWVVLGVSRLHYTLTTGRITSKSGAGVHARTAFGPEWHRILDECLRLRQDTSPDSLYGDRRSRRRDALAFLDHVVTAAQRLP